MEIYTCNLEMLKSTVTRATGRWDNDALAEFLCACQFEMVMLEIQAEVEYNRKLGPKESSGSLRRNK